MSRPDGVGAVVLDGESTSQSRGNGSGDKGGGDEDSGHCKLGRLVERKIRELLNFSSVD